MSSASEGGLTAQGNIPGLLAGDTIAGCRGNSSAGRLNRTIKIGTEHREKTARCEWDCLHEIAHIVTPPRKTEEAGKTNHHDHPWRMNYILLVRKMLGYRAARYLRQAFEQNNLSI